MDTQHNKKKKNRKAWKILFKHLEEYKPLIVRLALLGVISALANGTVPYIIGSFLDAILHFSRTITFWNITISVWLALLLVWVFVQLTANIVDWIIDKNGRLLQIKIELGYQCKALTHLLFVPLSFHKDEKIGMLSDMISKTGWQVASITENNTYCSRSTDIKCGGWNCGDSFYKSDFHVNPHHWSIGLYSGIDTTSCTN